MATRNSIPANSNGQRDSQRDARATPISETRLAPLTQQRMGISSGFTGDWFPPNNPMSPQAPEDGKGRAFDYPYGLNLSYIPRGEQGQNGIGFDMLRRMADPECGGLDLLRLVIETRKDQMKAQKFSIVGREKNDDGGTAAKAAEIMLRKPDGINTWRTWLGSILEDHFVLDATAVYFRQSSGGPLFEQVDGATLKVLIDNNGRIPVPPFPAYQQILHGLPSYDYTRNELGYYVYNARPGRLYGMSRVQQVVGIVTLALNRQLSVLNYYTAGTVPDMIVGVPKEWSVANVELFQKYWDSIMTGNLEVRRKVRFFPGEAKPYETKTEVLKNEFDEWLARIVCYCFSLSPQSLVKEVNRATAETSKEMAAEEGLEPTKLFVKDVIDDFLLRIGQPQLQLRWEDEEITDPKVKADVVVSYKGASIITLDESREMAGFAPATDAQMEELQPPEPIMAPGMDPANPDGETIPPKPGKKGQAPTSDTAGKIGKAATRRGRSLHPVPAHPTLSAKVERGIRAVAKRVLRSQRKALAAAVRARSEKLAKVSETDVHELLHVLEQTPWDSAARARLRTLLRELAAERSTAGLDHVAGYVGGTDAAFAELLQQANARAITWADARVGNLITEVSDTTRDEVNKLTAGAIEEGLTNTELADRIESDYQFSEDRSVMIARTETATAESQGTLAGYRESGVVVGKEWDADAEACDECVGNQDAGAIGLDDTFPSGDDAPPGHPHCECQLLPVIDGSVFGTADEEADQEAEAA